MNNRFIVNIKIAFSVVFTSQSLTEKIAIPLAFLFNR